MNSFAKGMRRKGHVAIEIVTHCWCPPGNPWYAQMLKWQFASFINYPPAHCGIIWTVFYCPDDLVTAKQIRRCRHVADQIQHRLYIDARPLNQGQLFRRSIGRNEAARRTWAEIVWFTDVDYLFGEGCLEAVAQQMNRNSLLHMPRQYWINFEHNQQKQVNCERPHHRIGQAMLEREFKNDLPKIDQSEFALKDQKIAIGGMQIVGGQFARFNGYLNGIDKWQTPVDPAMGFRSCKCDTAFRRVNHLHPVRIDIPNLFRIRHEIDGRDYDLQGNKVGKEAW